MYLLTRIFRSKSIRNRIIAEFTGQARAILPQISGEHGLRGVIMVSGSFRYSACTCVIYSSNIEQYRYSTYHSEI